jgi:PAS domain S-box-containing protein
MSKRNQIKESAERAEALEFTLWNEAAHYRAMVESSSDAILSKTLDGIILSWNRGAELLFGYTAEEMVGQSVTMLLPEDRHDEEPEILRRIRNGERVTHYETVRRRKDGSLVDISLTVSPIRDRDGTIIGASKIARDITNARRAQEQQGLLVREMNHRVKNLFALVGGLVSISARSAETPSDLATSIRDRLAALARAHDLTMQDMETDGPPVMISFVTLLETILAPYIETDSYDVTITGCDVPVSGNALTSLALLLHEFATNAAKYGALSQRGGRIAVHLAMEAPLLHLVWTESNGPIITEAPSSQGFGSKLEQATVRGQLNGTIERDWQPDGVIIRLSLDLQRLGA